jgi:pantothenate kinase type III
MESQQTFIDIGNSRIKVARRALNRTDAKRWEMIESWDRHEPDAILKASELIRMESGILGVSVVHDLSLKLDEILPGHIDWITSKQIPKSRSSYTEIASLGTDRFLLADAAWRESGLDRNVVVIGAGTACTIDLMDHTGLHLGGSIYPGLIPLQRSYELCMPALPVVDISLPAQWPGKSTNEAIQWGQAGLLQAGLLNALHRCKAIFSTFELYLTGGDAAIYRSFIENTEEADHSFIERTHMDAWLLFKGLEASKEWRKN